MDLLQARIARGPLWNWSRAPIVSLPRQSQHSSQVADERCALGRASLRADRCGADAALLLRGSNRLSAFARERCGTPLPMVLLLLVVSVSGCMSSLKVPPPPRYEYRLHYSSPSVKATPVPFVIQLTPFRTAKVYAGEEILYRQSAYEIGRYAYHHWITDPAGMVGDLLARDFVASQVYRAVLQGPSVVLSDYELSGEIDELEEYLAGGCTAHVRLRILLSRSRAGAKGPVIFQQAYEADEPCTMDDPGDLVAAMSRALQLISARIQQDVYEAIAIDAALATEAGAS